MLNRWWRCCQTTATARAAILAHLNGGDDPPTAVPAGALTATGRDETLR